LGDAAETYFLPGTPQISLGDAAGDALRFAVSLGFSNSCSHFHFVLEVAVASGETSWVDMWAVTTGSR
jgi:hypothetical protein